MLGLLFFARVGVSGSQVIFESHKIHTELYGSLIKKPRVFIRVPYMKPNILGL